MFCSAVFFLASTKVKAIEMFGTKCINEARNKNEALKLNPGISMQWNQTRINTYVNHFNILIIPK
jgi:hypothetical protein